MKRNSTVTPPRGKPFVEPTPPWHVVRKSKIHGNGVFANRRIRKGTRILEYFGDRISHRQADKRYENADPNDNHTFLFIVDKKTVLDATIGGNDARWINHSCDGNCDSEVQQGRVFIKARRTIEKGAELGYDYEIGRDKNDPDNVDEIYACRCGAAKCRGTMLWPAKKPEKRKAKSKAKSKGKAKKSKTAKRAKSKTGARRK